MSRLQEAARPLGWPAIALAAAGLGLAAANWIASPLGSPASPRALRRSRRRSACRRGARSCSRRSPSPRSGSGGAALRLHELDRSYLAARIGDTGRQRRSSSPAPRASRRTPFGWRQTCAASTASTLRERVLLELPAGRAPPQGAVLDLRARPVAPRGPETGFDERGWLERRGIHVVLHASGPWHVVGRRGGIGGVGDRLRTEIGDALSLGTTRRAAVAPRRQSCSAPTRASIRSSATRSRRRGSTTCSRSRARTSS